MVSQNSASSSRAAVPAPRLTLYTRSMSSACLLKLRFFELRNGILEEITSEVAESLGLDFFYPWIYARGSGMDHRAVIAQQYAAKVTGNKYASADLFNLN